MNTIHYLGVVYPALKSKWDKEGVEQKWMEGQKLKVNKFLEKKFLRMLEKMVYKRQNLLGAHLPTECWRSLLDETRSTMSTTKSRNWPLSRSSGQ